MPGISQEILQRVIECFPRCNFKIQRVDDKILVKWFDNEERVSYAYNYDDLGKIYVILGRSLLTIFTTTFTQIIIATEGSRGFRFLDATAEQDILLKIDEYATHRNIKG